MTVHKGIKYGFLFLIFLGIIGGTVLLIPKLKSPQQQQTQQEEPMRGVWFAFNEWNTTLKGNTEEEFGKNVDIILNNVKSLGCNTLFLHVRAFGDAMYESDYFPWSKSCSGRIGESPGYDPLKIFSEKAKKQGVALHAWINPLRTMTDQDFAGISDQYAIKQWYLANDRYRYYMKDGLGKYHMIPGNPKVRELVCNGARELVEKYPIAGVHMDDYFYPSGCDTFEENDREYYQESGSTLPIEQWRRQSTSELVHELYQTVKDVNKNCLFGISPQANMKNNENSMFIDVKEWVTQEGYLDYIAPQLYFGFKNESYPFDQAAKEWSDMVTCEKVKLYAGLPAYKIGMELDKNAGTAGQSEWKESLQGDNTMLKRELETLSSLPKYQGYIFYTYASFFLPDGTANPLLGQELAHMKE